MARRLPVALALALFITASSGWPLEARADDVAAAAAEFSAGESAFQSGDFRAAAQRFEAANRLAPAPSALWNAARSWDRAGEQARAANLYRAYLDVAPEGALDRDSATASLAALSGVLGRVLIVAPDASARFVDQQETLGAAWFVHPGSHLVEAVGPEGRRSRVVDVPAGTTVTVTLEAPPPQPMSAPRTTLEVVRDTEAPATPAERGGWPPWALWPFAATTAVATGLTIASGVDTLIAQDQYLEIPERERTQDLYDQGKFKQDRTNVLIGVSGGLALATALVGVLAIDWGDGALVALAPSGLGIRARF